MSADYAPDGVLFRLLMCAILRGVVGSALLPLIAIMFLCCRRGVLGDGCGAVAWRCGRSLGLPRFSPWPRSNKYFGHSKTPIQLESRGRWNEGCPRYAWEGPARRFCLFFCFFCLFCSLYWSIYNSMYHVHIIYVKYIYIHGVVVVSVGNLQENNGGIASSVVSLRPVCWCWRCR